MTTVIPVPLRNTALNATTRINIIIISTPIKSFTAIKMSTRPSRTQKKQPKQSETPEPTPSSTSTNPFTPSQITLDLFTKLLEHYPKTVEQVHRQKLASKKQPKSKTKSTKSPADLDSEINALTAEFLELDKKRYNDWPELVAERLENGNAGGLTKNDLVQIMQWKITHGHSRPMLMGMIKSNAETLVDSCLSAAVKALPSQRIFPKESIDALLPLRGVGPATASLILSILSSGSTNAEIPFYSDDVYLWVVDGVVPTVSGESVSGAGIELKVKYNLKEYEMLWEKVGEVAGRLNEGGSVSFLDIEKVAYVLKNIDVSGFEMGSGGDEAETKDRKRKVEDEEDTKEQKGGEKKKRTK